MLYYMFEKAFKLHVFREWERKQKLKFWREVFNNLPSGFVVLKSNSVIYANKAVQTLLSLNMTSNTLEQTNDESIKNIFKNIKKRDSISTLSDILFSQNEVKEIKGEKFDLKISDNKTTPLAVSTMKYCLGTETHKIVVLQDLSIFEELERERNLLEYQKSFFAMITHELRNPLHGIMGLLEILRNANLTDKQNRDCYIGLNTGKLMMCLINDILDFSQMEANKFKLNDDKFSAIETLNECIEVMNFRFEEKHVKLLLKISSQIPEMIRADKNRYKQIVFNLLGNALKFTKEGYTEIEASYDKSHKMLETKVTDTGTGIKEEDKPRLFQMYGTLDSQKENKSSRSGTRTNDL